MIYVAQEDFVVGFDDRHYINPEDSRHQKTAPTGFCDMDNLVDAFSISAKNLFAILVKLLRNFFKDVFNAPI